MELTKKDRIMLINQYEILKFLDEQNREHYEELIKILVNGYTIFYSDVEGWMSDDMPISEGKFVLNILDAYRSLENYKREHPEDTEVSEHYWGFFQGIDGNNEGEYLSFVLFLFDVQHKFTEQLVYRDKTDNYNTHGPTLNKYRSMVDEWLRLNRKISTHDDAMQILNA